MLFSDCRYHGYSLLCPDDPLHPEEIVLGVQNATSHVRSVDSVVEEREREEFGEELRVIWWTVEDKIPEPTDFVPAKRNEEVKGKAMSKLVIEGFARESEPPKELEPLADEQE